MSDGPLPLWVVKPRPLSQARAARVAEAVFRRSGLEQALQYSLGSSTGRPPEVSWRTLLVICIVHGILKDGLLLTDIEQTGHELYEAGLLPAVRKGGVSYDQIRKHLRRLTIALADESVRDHNHFWLDRRTGELRDCPAGCPGGTVIDLRTFSALLLRASVPPGAAQTTSFAIDSTDIETWAARRSWRRRPDVVTPEEHDDTAQLGSDRDSFGFPRVGDDGRLQHSIDPDARTGYRSGKNLAPKGNFLGWDFHLVVAVPEYGGAPVPHVALAMSLAPAGSLKSEPALSAVDAMVSVGHPVSTLLSDRGYSYLKPEHYALHLVARGIDSVHDLHTKQLGVHPGPITGTIWVDGWLYTSALPKSLRELGNRTLQMTAGEKAELAEQFDKRRPYAFQWMGRPDPRTGARRMRGPALKNKVRCVNVPATSRTDYNRPTTTCKRGEACGCGATVTVEVEDQAWTRQARPWGSTEWAASYGRRNAVELYNSELKHHRAHLARGYTRVLGTAANHVLLTFALVGLNIRILRDWHAKRLLPDPWMVYLGDTTDPDWAKKHGHRIRPPRKLSLHEKLGKTGKAPKRE